jgi:hypothetical protein
VESLLPLGGRWRAQRDGGGLCLDRNVLNDALQVVEHILRRDPKSSHALASQPMIPGGVVSEAKVVRFTINLNAQLQLIAIEIEHIWACWMLAAKA